MNQDQLTSAIRQILLAGGGFIIGKGWLTPDQLTMLIAGLAPIIGASVWAFYTRRSAALIASAAAQPAVRQIVTDAATAAAVPSSKVVAPGAAMAAGSGLAG